MANAVKVQKLNSAEELLSVLRPHDERWQPYPADWVFRGQWDSRLHLLPSAYRSAAWEPFSLVGETPFDPMSAYQSEIIQAQQEYSVLKRFHDDVDRVGLDVPNGIFVSTRFEAANQNDLEFLLDPAISTFAALAQHHGVPTRLLDWTRAGLLAAYFSAAGAAKHKDKVGFLTVWALSTAFVRYAQSVEQACGTLAMAPKLRIVTASRASNPNLHAQSGLFTLWFRTAKVQPLEEVVLQILSALDDLKDWRWTGGSPLFRFDLPWSEAPKLLRMLAYEQVDGAHAFPGRDGVVRGMKERSLWDRKD